MKHLSRKPISFNLISSHFLPYHQSLLQVFLVFAVDEAPSPMKSQPRVASFFLFSGVDISGLLVAKKDFWNFLNYLVYLF
uniref:Uncharacterized protein n=1 Tax=Salix viminalis TaxID=40686 RepID=A0A6N2LNQ2_SALVM